MFIVCRLYYALLNAMGVLKLRKFFETNTQPSKTDDVGNGMPYYKYQKPM